MVGFEPILGNPSLRVYRLINVARSRLQMYYEWAFRVHNIFYVVRSMNKLVLLEHVRV